MGRSGVGPPGQRYSVIAEAASTGTTELLNSLADIGGTALPGDVKFYQAEDGSLLADALGDITGGLPVCRVGLEPPAGYDYIVVTIDGEVVAKDTQHQEGWDLLAGDELQFYGAACGAATADAADVVVTYVCKK